MISPEMIKELRGKTGAGIMDCKNALQEADGNMEAAFDFLRTKGLAIAEKKASRTANEGLIYSYIHMGGKIGVMVEVNCESDFVAKTDDFQDFAKSVAMHIAAVKPLALTKDEIPADVLEREKKVYIEKAREQKKPENIIEKIVEGQIKKFYKDSCLLEQSYIKNPDISIEDFRKEVVGKLGENIQIKRFIRYEIGE